MTIPMTSEQDKVLRLMAEKYPTKEIVYEKIVYLQSQLMLPKGTEHFMSDLHGAYDAFFHILNNCSGVIKEKVDYCFGERMTEEEKAEFCTLIYYPREKVEQLTVQGKISGIWYQQNLANLLELTKLMSWKFPANKMRDYIPKRYESVIVELMNTRPEHDEAQLYYYKQLIETIVEIGGGADYIEAFSVLIKRLSVERIHIVGDFFDRGDRPDGILDLLMQHPSVDIQWGNHDVLWMGAALGSEVCIAGVIRNSLRYRNTDVLERGYGISLRPLSTFASRIYPDENPIKAAERAVTMMMFKLEGALIQRNPDFQMEDRLLLDKIDYSSSYVTLGNGRRVELESAYFPTIDNGADCYELTEEEQHIIADLRSYFLESKALQRHVNYLYERGSMYMCYNGNLLFHACVPLDETGEFRTIAYKGKEYCGRAWFDFCEEKAREALAQSEMEFKAHFIFSMREAIESARHEFRDLNYSLDQFQFHKDKYSFLITPSAKYKPFYDAVMTADWEMAGGLFAETDAAANEQAMELFEKLVKGTPEEQEEFSDYRRYLDYDIRITDTVGQSYLYSRVLRQTSGGETQTPFYIAILAAFQQIYNDKTIRLTVFDEAFNKMDEERIKSCIQLIKRMDMQLIVAVPDEKLAAIAPLMDQSIIVTNAGNHCFTDELGDVRTWEKGMTHEANREQGTL